MTATWRAHARLYWIARLTNQESDGDKYGLYERFYEAVQAERLPLLSLAEQRAFFAERFQVNGLAFDIAKGKAALYMDRTFSLAGEINLRAVPAFLIDGATLFWKKIKANTCFW